MAIHWTKRIDEICFDEWSSQANAGDWCEVQDEGHIESSATDSGPHCHPSNSTKLDCVFVCLCLYCVWLLKARLKIRFSYFNKLFGKWNRHKWLQPNRFVYNDGRWFFFFSFPIRFGFCWRTENWMKGKWKQRERKSEPWQVVNRITVFCLYSLFCSFLCILNLSMLRLWICFDSAAITAAAAAAEADTEKGLVVRFDIYIILIYIAISLDNYVFTSLLDMARL